METKDTDIIELKEEELATITGGCENPGSKPKEPAKLVAMPPKLSLDLKKYAGLTTYEKNLIDE